MGWRLIIGLPLAALIALGLFIAMSYLIDPGDVDVEEREPREDITLGPDRGDEGDDEIERPDPTKIEQPDPPDTTPDITIDRPIIDGGSLPTVGPIDELGPPTLERDPQPIVRVPPQNWESCLSGNAGEDHYVRLVFDVAPTGETANVEAVESSKRCLERSAIRAAQGWRYTPKVQNGEPVWQYGINTTIRFRLEG
ncbi:MAG: energy transducer TonB [Pseudomonadota bacterium]